MNTYQEDKNSMHLITIAYLGEHAEETAQLPAFVDEQEKLALNLAATGVIIKKQQLDTSGVGLNKTILENLAIGKGLDLSKRLVAFAKVSENIELEKKAKLNTSLKTTADTVLKEKLEGLYDLGVEYKVAAAAFGVTDGLLEGVQSAINDYFESIPRPRLGIADMKELTKELKDHQKVTDEILNVIDSLVDMVKETSPVFWQGYFNARKIVKSGVRHMSMKIQVNEAGSGMGQKGVVLEIVEQAGEGIKASSELTKTVKRTSDMGGTTAKVLNDGTYLITAKKPGFVSQTVQANVSGGEMTKVVIELVKS